MPFIQLRKVEKTKEGYDVHADVYTKIFLEDFFKMPTASLRFEVIEQQGKMFVRRTWGGPGGRFYIDVWKELQRETAETIKKMAGGEKK